MHRRFFNELRQKNSSHQGYSLDIRCSHRSSIAIGLIVLTFLDRMALKPLWQQLKKFGCMCGVAVLAPYFITASL